jgi:hypothetical protein
MSDVWLPDPAGQEEILAEAQLRPASDDAVERAASAAGRASPDDALTAEDIRELPVVSIGRPQHVPLSEIYAEPPPAVREAAAGDEFFLVRVSCSFLPRKDDVVVEWARFVVQLHADPEGRRPVVFDLYPREIEKTVERDVRISLSPSVKFTEVEASAGGVAFGYSYSELQPMVTGAEFDEGTKAVWDYEKAAGSPVRGWKKMYLLAKAPKGMARAEASLAVTADVSVRGIFRLPAVFRKPEQHGAPVVTARLWG